MVTLFPRGAAAAAVVVLAVLGAAFAISRSNQGVGAAPSPSASTCPPGDLGPNGQVVGIGTTLAGCTRYTTDGYWFTVVGQPGWTVEASDANATTWSHDSGSGSVSMIRLGKVIGPGGSGSALPSDLVAWLKNRSEMALTDAGSTTVGGFRATVLDGIVGGSGASASSGTRVALACDIGLGTAGDCTPSNATLAVSTGDHVEFVVVSVNGHPDLIALSAKAIDWPAERTALQAFVNSITFQGATG